MLYAEALTDREKKNYLYLIAYVLLIYVSLPFAPDIWKAFYRAIGQKAYLAPAASIVIIGGMIFLYLLFYKREKNWTTYLAFIAIAGAYFVGMKMYPEPPERFHFIEYAGVGYFLARLCSDGKKGYLSAVPWVFIIGLGDEIIQYFLPNRFFEWRDVFGNLAGGVLGLLLIKFVIRKGKV